MNFYLLEKLAPCSHATYGECQENTPRTAGNIPDTGERGASCLAQQGRSTGHLHSGKACASSSTRSSQLVALMWLILNLQWLWARWHLHKSSRRGLFQIFLPNGQLGREPQHSLESTEIQTMVSSALQAQGGSWKPQTTATALPPPVERGDAGPRATRTRVPEQSQATACLHWSVFQRDWHILCELQNNSKAMVTSSESFYRGFNWVLCKQ